jgi:UDP-N-acetylglucosamine/UDP-N-acetylgalactosamine diphosphorylase
MTLEDVKKILENEEQTHLLRFYDELKESEKEQFLEQLSAIDYGLLDLLRDKDELGKKGVISPITKCVSIEDAKANKEHFESIGLDAIKKGKVAALLLAGGQGTRLGSDKPKGMYNIGITKDVYIFERIVRNLLDVVEKSGAWIPLYIMTSEKNNDDTIDFFEKMNYFGYDKKYVEFFVQEMAPACDYNGKIYLEEKGRVATSPNGNGGWFISLMKSGIGEKAKKAGVEWINVFAVDNVCQRIADPVFVGATIDSGMPSGSKVVSKVSPEEKVGVLCYEDGKPSIVEYYELSEEMRYERNEKGDLVYKDGVILNYLFRFDKLEDIMNNQLVVHIVEKKIPYINDEGEKVSPEEPNGYKFETLVLDMIHMMDDCLAFEVDRSYEFAPIKNKTGVDSVESARELLKQNGVEL